MFDIHRAFELLNEMVEESNKPEIIRIDVIVESSNKLNEEETSNKYDEQTLEDWYDFASTIEGIVDNLCDVVNISLSKNPDSLSEYIDFYLLDKDGNRKNYLIDLRLSDHGSTTNARRNRVRKVKKIDDNYELMSIIVKDKSFDSYHKAIEYLRKILEEKSN